MCVCEGRKKGGRDTKTEQERDRVMGDLEIQNRRERERVVYSALMNPWPVSVYLNVYYQK